jgi:hypothetical protein
VSTKNPKHFYETYPTKKALQLLSGFVVTNALPCADSGGTITSKDAILETQNVFSLGFIEFANIMLTMYHSLVRSTPCMTHGHTSD